MNQHETMNRPTIVKTGPGGVFVRNYTGMEDANHPSVWDDCKALGKFVWRALKGKR